MTVKKQCSGVTLIEIVVVLAILLFLMAFSLPFLFRLRTQADSTRGRNNLRQLAIGAHNYHDLLRSFPPAVGHDRNGVSGSLLFHLLPFVEGHNMRKRGAW